MVVAPVTSEDRVHVVQVVPLLKLSHLGDRVYDYRVPPGLSDKLVPGSVVTAPFGHRSARAIVVSCGDTFDGDPAALRDITAVSADAVPEALMALAAAVARRYLATLESCLRLQRIWTRF